MKIGVPKEVKLFEGRVGLIPEAADELIKAGHDVYIQSSAGDISGYPDEVYQAIGVKILPDAATLYAESELIIKVKEPQPEELQYLHQNHILFCYLHLAAEPELLAGLLEIGLTGVAFETVSEQGRLPLLAPMSDIAGRVAAQAGCHYLHKPLEGKGILLGGLPAAERGNAVVIGAGVAGASSIELLAGMGANVTVFDKNIQRLQAVREMSPNITGLYPYPASIHDAVAEADLVIGAVLIPGAKAPYVVTKEMVKSMEPGSVIVDISVDQGGCVETTRPTTYKEPTYTWENVVHFAVTNMPSAAPRMASQVLSAAITPYALELAQDDWRNCPALLAGVNVEDGEIKLNALR